MNKEIENSFKKYFPNGWIEVHSYKGLGGTPLTSVYCGLIGDKKDLPFGYKENDPANQKFLISDYGNGLEVKNLIGGISYNPPEGSYLAMDTKKVPWRNFKKSNPEKVIQKFDKFFEGFRKMVDETKEDIYGYENYDKKYFA